MIRMKSVALLPSPHMCNRRALGRSNRLSDTAPTIVPPEHDRGPLRWGDLNTRLVTDAAGPAPQI